jgi:hypothetical protein
MVLGALLFAMLPALLVAAVIMYAFARPSRGRLAPLGAALGVAAAVLVGNWVNRNWSLDPDCSVSEAPEHIALRDSVNLSNGTSDWNRLPLAALVALFVGVVVWPAWVPAGLGWPLRAGAVALMATWPVPDHAVAELRWLPAVFVVVVLLNWALLEELASQAPGGSLPFGMALVAFVGAFVLHQSAYSSSVDAAATLSAGLMGVAAVAARGKVDGGAALPGAAVFLAGLLLAGKSETYVEALPWASFVAVGAAPLVLMLTLLPPVRDWQGWKLAAARILLLALPLAAAVALGLEAGLPFDDAGQE